VKSLIYLFFSLDNESLVSHYHERLYTLGADVDRRREGMDKKRE